MKQADAKNPQDDEGPESTGVLAMGKSALAQAQATVAQQLPQIEDFDPSTMVEMFVALVFGMRRAGKSVLAVHLLSFFAEQFDEAWLFSSTGEFQPWFWSMFDERRIIDCSNGFREDIFNAILDEQTGEKRKLMNKYKDRKADGKKEFIMKKQKKVLIVLDDVVYDTGVQRSGSLAKVATTGRHLGVSLICLSQNVAKSGSFGPQVRGNIDYVFSTAMNSAEDYETLGRLYFGRQGWKVGMEFCQKVCEKDYTFAVGQLHVKGAHELKDFCNKITPPDPDKCKYKYKLERKRKREEDEGLDLSLYGFKSQVLDNIAGREVTHTRMHHASKYPVL